jgi:hypothetical protein
MTNYLEEAIKIDPEGKFCGKCGDINTNCDDEGWFMVKGKCLCNSCYFYSGHKTAER